MLGRRRVTVRTSFALHAVGLHALVQQADAQAHVDGHPLFVDHAFAGVSI